MIRCDLCEAAVITTRYASDDESWVAECEICAVPMIVWREHDPDPPSHVRERLWAKLAAVADEVIGEGLWRLDDHMRNIPDHYHAHARRHWSPPW